MIPSCTLFLMKWITSLIPYEKSSAHKTHRPEKKWNLALYGEKEILMFLPVKWLFEIGHFREKNGIVLRRKWVPKYLQ